MDNILSALKDTASVTLIPSTTTVEKDDKGQIGISSQLLISLLERISATTCAIRLHQCLVGGGAPLCPCLYVVQVFANSPVARDGSVAAGDEIVAVNEVPCLITHLLRVRMLYRCRYGASKRAP